MRPVDLVRAQLELECIGVDDGGLLHRIPGEDPDEIHRVFVARHSGGIELFIRDDVDATVAGALRRLPRERLWKHPGEIAPILYGAALTPEGSWRGSAYYFASAYPEDSFPLVTMSEGRFVVLVEGSAVSSAWSSRANGRCAELATETTEAHRRRGFATQVCRAWANHQLSLGRTPFYSHVSGNIASAALANRLNAKHFMDCASYP